MIKEDKIRALGFLAVVGVIIYIATRKKKAPTVTKEVVEKSSFTGSKLGTRVLFTLTNNTDKEQDVPLFNAWSNIQNPDVGINPSMAEFNRTLLTNAKTVSMIEIKANNNQSQAQMPITKYCKDASGEIKQENYNPMVSVYQKATDMTSVQPKDLTLDGSCYLQYKLLPKTTVVMTINYTK